MIKVNIKEEVAGLEAEAEKRWQEATEEERENFVSYETKVTAFLNEDKTLITHKHIFIPALHKTYVKNYGNEWFSLADTECDYCK